MTRREYLKHLLGKLDCKPMEIDRPLPIVDRSRPESESPLAVVTAIPHYLQHGAIIVAHTSEPEPRQVTYSRAITQVGSRPGSESITRIADLVTMTGINPSEAPTDPHLRAPIPRMRTVCGRGQSTEA